MTTETTKLKPLSERKKAISADFISPEERIRLKDTKARSHETQIKDDLTVSEEHTHKEEEKELKLFKPNVTSSDNTLNRTELDGWYQELKILENKLEGLNNKNAINLSQSEQDEIKQSALEIRANAKSIENEIFLWFETLYQSTKKFSSEFVISNIEIPSISLPSSDDINFISPQKS